MSKLRLYLLVFCNHEWIRPEMQGFLFSSDHLCFEQDLFQIYLILNLKWLTVFFIAHDVHYKHCLHGIHHKIIFSYLLTFHELTICLHLSLYSWVRLLHTVYHRHNWYSGIYPGKLKGILVQLLMSFSNFMQCL